MFSVQDLIAIAVQKEIDTALAADAALDAVAIQQIRDQATASITAALAADAAADAAVLKAKDDAYAALLAEYNAYKIAHPATGTPPVEPPVEPPVTPPSTFDPRTMTIAQIEAATGPRIPVSSMTKSGSVTINKAGTYTGIDYSGTVTIEVAGGVVKFVDCRFNGLGGYYAVINQPEKFKADEIRFEYCEASRAVNCIAGCNMYIYRCDFHDWENAVNLFGGGSTLIENYIHGQSMQASSSPHYDGVECNGDGNHKLLRNYVVNTANQTSALMFDNYFGGVLRDIEIDGNYLAGGGYTLYFDTRFDAAHQATVNVKVTNNTLKKGSFGHLALYDSGVVVGPTNKLI